MTAVFGDEGEVEPRTAILVALADAGGLLGQVFDKRRLAGRKERLEALTSGDAVGTAARDAVEAAQTAAAVVATMAAVNVAVFS